MRYTNRQRAAQVLASRIERTLHQPMTVQEVQDALGEDTHFQPTTVQQVADEASTMASTLLGMLDQVNTSERYGEPRIPVEGV